MKLLHPHFIKFEKPKNELNLTFSARVVEKGEKKILDFFQKEIENIIKKQKMLKDIEIEDSLGSLRKRIKRGDRFIYRYPPRRLHFSIVNFATYEIRNLSKFNEVSKKIKEKANFESLKDKIEEFKGQFQKSIKVKIEGIYLPAR